MVVDVLSKKGWGGWAWALSQLERGLEKSARPWCWIQIEAQEEGELYPTAFSPGVRAALAQRALWCVRVHEATALKAAILILESGNFEGVLLSGDVASTRGSFWNAWGRRWQRAAQKGGCQWIWVHEQVIPGWAFQVRLEWTGPGVWDIKRGHGFVQEEKQGGRRHRAAHPTDQTAA